MTCTNDCWVGMILTPELGPTLDSIRLYLQVEVVLGQLEDSLWKISPEEK